MSIIETEQIIEATEKITLGTVLGILEPIANTSAPSGCASLQRSPVVQELISDVADFNPDSEKTGTMVVRFGNLERISNQEYFAHADQISYAVPHSTSAGETELIPLCAHRQGVGLENPATVLRYNPRHHILEVVAEGTIGTDEGKKPFFVGGGSTPELKLADRVVYNLSLNFQPETGHVSGAGIDNAAAMAAVLVAAKAIKEASQKAGVDPRELNLAFVFPDQEEGVPDNNATFGRGARAYLRSIPTPRLMINVDGHDAPLMESALYAQLASNGKGVIVPPQLYVPFADFMEGLRQHGIKNEPTEDNQGSVSRSDDVAMMEVSPNALLLGYPVENPHFNAGSPTTSLESLTNLSKAIVWAALRFRPTI